MARENRHRLAQGLGGRLGRASGEGALGLDPGRDHHAGGRRLHGVEVWAVGGDGTRAAGEQGVVARPVVLGRQAQLRGIGRGLGGEGLGELALPGRQRDERGQAGPEATLLVRRLNVALGGEGPLGVGKDAEQRWLMRHERGHVGGVSRHQGERGDRPAAAREQLHRTGAERLDKVVQVLGLPLGVVVGAAVGASAAAEAPGIVCDGAVVEVRREGAEATGVHGLGDHEQRRAPIGGRQVAAHVIRQGRARSLEGAGGGHVVLLSHQPLPTDGGRTGD